MNHKPTSSTIYGKYIKRLLETGRPERYHADKKAERESGVVLAGAMFVSAVLGMGGLY